MPRFLGSCLPCGLGKAVPTALFLSPQLRFRPSSLDKHQSLLSPFSPQAGPCPTAALPHLGTQGRSSPADTMVWSLGLEAGQRPRAMGSLSGGDRIEPRSLGNRRPWAGLKGPVPPPRPLPTPETPAELWSRRSLSGCGWGMVGEAGVRCEWCPEGHLPFAEEEEWDPGGAEPGYPADGQ